MHPGLASWGVFLRSFSWGHVRQLDRVSRELLARSWAAGAGPGAAPFTIDLDSTLCETYGLAKEGARQHGYTGVRGYHPLLAVAAGTGDVLMARLREGRANTARGAAHFLRETVGRVRAAGASGQLTVRADSGFYNHAVVAVCRKQDVRFSITIRQQPSVRRLIEAIAQEDWTPIPYWLPCGASSRRPAHSSRSSWTTDADSGEPLVWEPATRGWSRPASTSSTSRQSSGSRRSYRFPNPHEKLRYSWAVSLPAPAA